jgi:hypothetical protein
MAAMDGIRTRSPRDRHELDTALRTGLDLVKAVAPDLRYRLVGAALAELPCVTAPQWLAPAKQYDACYSLGGVEFSVSTVEVPDDADGYECQGPGPWRHFVTVARGEHRVPCVRPELRLTTEFLRDRPDRYRPLLAHLGTHGADLRLLELSMAVRRVPESFRHLTRALPAATGRP